LLSVVEDSFENKKGPIVLFFEGARTNGKGFIGLKDEVANDLVEFQKK
jgi:hypothetical protein